MAATDTVESVAALRRDLIERIRSLRAARRERSLTSRTYHRERERLVAQIDRLSARVYALRRLCRG